jgi:hypothetical protein
MTQDQIDFIEALRTVSSQIADYVQTQIENGTSLDHVQAQLRNVMAAVDGLRAA